MPILKIGTFSSNKDSKEELKTSFQNKKVSIKESDKKKQQEVMQSVKIQQMPSRTKKEKDNAI